MAVKNKLRLDSILLTVEWNDEFHELRLTARNWSRVRRGFALRIRGRSYEYEGETFQTVWNFLTGSEDELRVEYCRHGDVGVGWIGKLGDVEFAERPAKAGA